MGQSEGIREQNGVTRQPMTAPAMQKQIRGSALLLSGRGCSLLMNLVTQILIVRALSRTDYGALAYVISVVELLSIVSLIAIDKTVLRFGAIYHEQKDNSRFAGALFLAMFVPTVAGLAIIATLTMAGPAVISLLALDSTSWSLLTVICLLIPANGFASVSLSLITVVKGARSVFVRKHLLTPAIKLLLVALAAAISSQPQDLAVALLIAGICGLAADLWLVGRLLVTEQLLGYFRPHRIVLPIREFVCYSLPVLASDLSFMVRGTLLVVLLGWLGSSEQTAALRAVLPLVRLNELVLLNFMVLFVPAASRLFANDKLEQLWETHRQTNLWIMVLSFPLFAVTTALAGPLTVLMFGAAYADASLLLAVLSAGYYVQAVYGLNGHLLRVLGRIRLLLAADIAGGILLLVAALAMIPKWGALGAAIAAAGGIVVHSHLRSLAVDCVTGTRPSGTGNQFAIVVTLSAAAFVTFVSICWSPGWIAGSSVAVAASITVLVALRDRLNVGESFPELRKLPFLSHLLPASRQQVATTDQGSSTPKRLAYMMSRFPKITETFILREMVEMRRLGMEVRVYPLQRERTSVVHPEVKDFIPDTHFTPWISVSIVIANIRTLLRTPTAYITTFATLVRTNLGSNRYLAGALLFFPKSVYLGEQMQRDGIQHLHAHFASHPAMAAWVIHQFTGIPYSFTAHGSDLHRDQHMLTDKVAAAHVTVTISDYNRRLILETCGSEFSDRVRVVHCGIDPQLFPVRRQKTLFDQRRGPFQIACIGTLHEVKGQRYLLDACQQLASDGFDIVCHLIGDGTDRSVLEEMAAAANLSEQIIFHGRRTAPEIRDLLANVDVIVAPSVPTSDGRREGIPVVLMEGLGSGIPAIGSDLSGIPELVRHEETGLLVPSRDHVAIAEAILRLATDDDLRQRCASAGSRLVLREFHVAKNTQALLQLIQGAEVSASDNRECSQPQLPSSEEPENVESTCLV